MLRAQAAALWGRGGKRRGTGGWRRAARTSCPVPFSWTSIQTVERPRRCACLPEACGAVDISRALAARAKHTTSPR